MAGDVGDRRAGLPQHPLRLPQSQRRDEVDEPPAGLLLEAAGEVPLAHVHGARDPAQRDVAVRVVLPQEPDSTANARRQFEPIRIGQLASRPGLRVRVRVRARRVAHGGWCRAPFDQVDALAGVPVAGQGTDQLARRADLDPRWTDRHPAVVQPGLHAGPDEPGSLAVQFRGQQPPGAVRDLPPQRPRQRDGQHRRVRPGRPHPLDPDLPGVQRQNERAQAVVDPPVHPAVQAEREQAADDVPVRVPAVEHHHLGRLQGGAGAEVRGEVRDAEQLRVVVRHQLAQGVAPVVEEHRRAQPG